MGTEATVVSGYVRKILQLQLKVERILLGAWPEPTKLVEVDHGVRMAMPALVIAESISNGGFSCTHRAVEKHHVRHTTSLAHNRADRSAHSRWLAFPAAE
jgi:hypothetical protein